MDIPDEKFAITSFIAGLGIQSKDLMFSISKNPQASMAEVLAKAEKYINGEEALISKRGSFSARKEKSKDEKSGTEAPGDEETKTNPHGGAGRIEIDLQREEVTLGTVKSTPAQAAAAVPTSAVHPPDALSISRPVRGTT